MSRLLLGQLLRGQCCVADCCLVSAFVHENTASSLLNRWHGAKPVRTAGLSMLLSQGKGYGSVPLAVLQITSLQITSCLETWTPLPVKSD